MRGVGTAGRVVAEEFVSAGDVNGEIATTASFAGEPDDEDEEGGAPTRCETPAVGGRSPARPAPGAAWRSTPPPAVCFCSPRSAEGTRSSPHSATVQEAARQ